MKNVLTLLTMLALLLMACPVAALTPEQAKRIEARVALELRLNPAYLWGGKWLKKTGGRWIDNKREAMVPGAPDDCSGKITAVRFDADVKDEDGRRGRRTTAARMAAGLDGWNFPETPYTQALAWAIPFMTLSADRPNGHTGIYTRDVSYGVTTMAHESSKWGFIEVLVDFNRPENYWGKRTTCIRQM